MKRTETEVHAVAPSFSPEDLARTLRHEIGDFLQKVYAVVAILQDRLPAGLDQERDILRSLRHRAEQCKNLVDAMQDFLCPITLDIQPVDLAQVLAALISAARESYPRLQVVADLPGPVPVAADPERLFEVGKLLIENACAAARERVTVKAVADQASGRAEWTVTDDGPGVAPELLSRLFIPFFTTRQGHAGLGLALAQKIIHLNKGQISAANLPESGFRVKVNLATVVSVPSDAPSPRHFGT